ncbi:tax1-binding protein 1-like isoform X1 [Sitophilus oryzae]|uniref:Tax1-binding protein 1-like isoform X1 n=1 Tax=Sitophilus oryzae TaxID=7048 RepID=A0A6J2XT50_SITOR|nr:tax1-binding protein 1-like isoform X1 [Sitophilus oryzae]
MDEENANSTIYAVCVEFLSVLDQYSISDDLHCEFKFNDYIPQDGDRITLFKFGWNDAKDYLLFEWVPFGLKETRYFVTFPKDVLPKNQLQLYQICYINGENEVMGASTPFQFNAEPSEVKQDSKPTNFDVTDSKISTNKDQELSLLKEENIMLKDTLKALISKRLIKNYDQEIAEVKELTESLKKMLLDHEKEIDSLKSKIRQGGEEFRKLYLEKVKVERKYEKLRNKTIKEERNKTIESNDKLSFDLGDLPSLPPFDIKHVIS